ncbi:hypothetical protein [Gemmatimonas groenlandica]|uniref:Uncharacterized protein n=1 Tax=Gemmatimonas groenlandica TaxID=2732249 RepID=A0A6M4IP80_9BACT|nr:hypothetical protein [Gemmatimonas groenlandica]QJR36540.1 hypothetical protein HKW67_14005 [Gemmatimonas groenlandica]
MSQSQKAALAGIVLAAAAVVGGSSIGEMQLGASAFAPGSVAGCASVPSSQLNEPEVTVWRGVATQPNLQYALVWNVQFRSYEIVWRNRSERDLRFRFAADSLGTPATRVRERVLPAGITESLPGEGLVPGKETGVVCVQVVAGNAATS